MTAITFEPPQRKRGALTWVATNRVTTAVALVMLLVLLIVAIAPWTAPHDPTAFVSDDRGTPPSWKFLLGVDSLGRDMLSRIIWGGRTSLGIATGAVLAAIGIGTCIGLISGYALGRFDIIIQRLVDAMMAIPGVVLALVIVSTLGTGITNVIAAIAILSVPATIRVTRSLALSLRNSGYVEASRATGATPARLILRHILPNAAGPILVMSTFLFGNAILVEATLSFLGLGVQPPTPTWGQMLGGEARLYMLQSPWIAIPPGVAITMMVGLANLLGDGLRDIWDPRLGGR